jgi:hypothetical protein
MKRQVMQPFRPLRSQAQKRGSNEESSGVETRQGEHNETEIWKGISSAMIARSFLLAYRIMGKIIETKVDTDWLKNGAPHCHVRRDFFDTDRGVVKIADVVEVSEDETAASQCY